MSSSFFKYWAIAATAIALVLLGYLIGQHTAQSPEVLAESVQSQPAGVAGPHREPAESGTSAATNEGGAVVDQLPPYIIPDAFLALPSEWRTPLSEDHFDGYAILFDPPRREVIIEKCQHRGYFDTASGQPVPMGWEFCDNLLWGQLLELDEHSARVGSRRGELIDMSLSLSNENGVSQLALTFPGHQMNLVPGSKNDLLQAMENTALIQEQKRLVFEFQKAVEQKQRQE